MKIKNQFIVNDEGKLLYMTLREWVKQLELKPLQLYLFKTNLRGKTASVYYRGYGVKWEDLKEHYNELFYVNNADLSSISIHYKKLVKPKRPTGRPSWVRRPALMMADEEGANND